MGRPVKEAPQLLSDAREMLAWLEKRPVAGRGDGLDLDEQTAWLRHFVNVAERLEAQASVIEAARRWADAETSEAYSDALRELRLAVAAWGET